MLKIDDPDLWTKINDIPNEELWKIHMLLKKN